jgi:hypothetical protein
LAGDHHLDDEQLLRRWRDSDQRSRARRTSRRRGRTGLVVATLVAIAGVLAVAVSQRRDEDLVLPAAPPHAEAQVKGVRARSPAPVLAIGAIRRAWRFAQSRGGPVSFAVVDTEGHLRGRRLARPYVSASVVKAMLLVAELRRLASQGTPLDSTTAGALEAMITVSDNDAADAIYWRVGDPGLLAVARLAGMRRFTVAGHWTTAMVTAADLARLFARLRRLLPPRHRAMALRLLRSVTAEQRWGIPRAADGRWTVHFKGGWRATELGELVHQAAWLSAGGSGLAVAVLTDGQRSRLYAIHTIRGVADRLLQ